VVSLEKFVMDTYPGTNKPSGYASFVQIEDTGGGRSFKSKIWMNHPLKYRGFTLFQSTFMCEGDRWATVLAVSKDHGQTVVFVGYFTLLVGLVWTLANSLRTYKPPKLPVELGTKASHLLMPMMLLLGILLVSAQAPKTDTSAPLASAKLAKLPVQHDGRAMPFDTYARDVVKAITGENRWLGEGQVFTLAHWLDTPEYTANSDNVLIGSADLALAMGLPASAKHASFLQIFQNEGFAQQLQLYVHCRDYGLPIDKTMEAAFGLQKRLDLMRRVILGSGVRPLPTDAAWQPLENASSESLARLLNGPYLDGWPSETKINMEIFYNVLKPLRIAWIFAIFAIALLVAAVAKKRKWLNVAALSALACSFGMMTLCIALRWVAGERVPAANMYESMLFLSWGLGLVAIASCVFCKTKALALNAAGMAALAMVLTDLLPLDSFIRPIAPVLAGTPWLAIHVPIIMAGYALLVAGMAAAHLYVGAQVFCRNWKYSKGMADKVFEMLYWYNAIGSILLLAGIMTGSIWAASSWGRYWGWDPKEVWSLVAFLAYMAITHAMVAGLVGKFGVAICSILAFQTILMAYLGVNYVLAMGLHSYGMGDSPMAMWLVIVFVVELAFVGAALRGQGVAITPPPSISN
jgi:ABC-type transport system involved in cytochrome c biogenesis permease subunit